MPFKQRGPANALTASATQVLSPVVSLGAAFGIVRGFRARNWASSAKAAAGADVLMKVKLVDAASVVFYLDAADRDYATAEVFVAFEQDDTSTGLGVTSVDATGAAATAGAGNGYVAKSPITITALNGATVTDFFEVLLLVEI